MRYHILKLEKKKKKSDKFKGKNVFLKKYKGITINVFMECYWFYYIVFAF